MQTDNFWTNRATTTSAAVLANQMEQLSVKNQTNTSKNNENKQPSATTTTVESRSPADGILGETSSVATRTSDGHPDNSNPQGGMKYAGGNENSSVVAVNHTEDGKGAENRKPNTDKHYVKVPPTKKDSRKLFVGGIPSNVTDEEFRAFFEQFGEVIDSVVMYDRDTHRSRGFGFVTFESLAVAESVLSEARQRNHKLTIHGKDCEVKAAEPKVSNHDAHFHGHQYRDKRKNHDNRTAFLKDDLVRNSVGIPLQGFSGYAAPPYYQNLSAYQQQYYFNAPAPMYGAPQGASYASSQSSFDQDSVYPNQNAPYGGYPYQPGYYQNPQPVSANYGNVGYPMAYTGEESPYPEKAYVPPPTSSSPYTMPGYGYTPSPFSPVGVGVPTPPPPQAVVPGYVTVSPYQALSELAQFGSDQSSTTDNQTEEAKQHQD